MFLCIRKKHIKFFLNLILSGLISSISTTSILIFLKPWEAKPPSKVENKKENFIFYKQKPEDGTKLEEKKIDARKEDDENFIPEGLKFNNLLAIYKGRICERMMSKEEMVEPLIDLVKKFKQNLPQDVTLYQMIPPSSGELYFPKRITKEISNKENIEKIYSELEKENIKTINLYNTFENNKDKYIYFKTDHHWTQLGSYFAYEEFAKIANLENPLKIENLQKGRTVNFLGSLFKTNPTFCSSFWNNQDFIEFYDVKICNKSPLYTAKKINPNVLSFYSNFFARNNSIGLINSSITNKRKILVIGDSYKDCFSYFLSNHYEEVVDFFYDEKCKKYPNILELLKKENIKEILIVYYANNINSGKINKKISSLM